MIEILKEYTTKRLELLKLVATEKTSVGSGFIVFVLLLFSFAAFFVLMLNIAVGLLIGHSLGNYGYGLLIVSVFYLILFILVIIFRRFIMKSVANKIIDFLNE